MGSHELIASAQPRRRPFSGIYFLIYRGEIVYVGQSRNVETRIASHSEHDVEFDSWSALECELQDLDDWESHYQQKFKPKFNAARTHRCKAITTPFGEFQSVKLASESTGIKLLEVYKNISSGKSGWAYRKEPPVSVMTRKEPLPRKRQGHSEDSASTITVSPSAAALRRWLAACPLPA